MALLDFTPASGTGATVTVTKTVSAGSTITVFAFRGGSQTASISDGVNTYTERLNFSDGTFYRLYVWTATNVAAGSTTITLTQGGGGPEWFLHAYEDTDAPTSLSFDATDGFTANSTSQHAAGASGITIGSGSRAITIFFQDRANTNTHTGWSSISAAANSGGWYPYAAARVFPSGASGERGTLTASAGGNYVAAIVAIKADAPSGGGPLTGGLTRSTLTKGRLIA